MNTFLEVGLIEENMTCFKASVVRISLISSEKYKAYMYNETICYTMFLIS